MKNFKFCAVVLLFNFCFLHYPCFAEPLSSSDLINNAKEYDGQSVVFSGEVIGEVMLRQDHAWVNVNDGKNALGIWTPRALVTGITYSGAYQSQGDLVEIQGIFHRACPEHGGDLDIHADTIIIKEKGALFEHTINESKVRISVVLLITVLLFAAAYAVLRRLK